MDATKFSIIGSYFLMKVEDCFGLLERNRTDRGAIVLFQVILLEDRDRGIITVLSVNPNEPPHL